MILIVYYDLHQYRIVTIISLLHNFHVLQIMEHNVTSCVHPDEIIGLVYTNSYYYARTYIHTCKYMHTHNNSNNETYLLVNKYFKIYYLSTKYINKININKNIDTN